MNIALLLALDVRSTCLSARVTALLTCVSLTVFGGCSKSRRSSIPESQVEASLDPHASFTKDSSVRLSGTIGRAGVIRIRGAADPFDAETASNGVFEVNVPLGLNRLNRIQLVPRFASGTEGLALTTQISQDSEPPSVWIDAPNPDETVAFDRVNVAGRVSDRLMGSEGLTVSVNGVTAVVDVGIGTNGTFLAKNVPIEAANAMTTIEAVAADALGNVGRTSIRVARPTGAPARVVEVTGDCQSALVGQGLATPIAIRLQRTEGTAFTGKIVTFSVERSDGRLSIDGINNFAMSQQSRTNADGWASVHWKLGSDAGCGNNRVRAHSEGVGDVVFFASGNRTEPRQINIGEGNNQKAEVRTIAPLPLVAWVSDGCNGAPDIDVTFSTNGAALGTVKTSRTGHARFPYRLTATAGPQTVEATFANNPGLPAVFTIYGLDRDPARLTTFEGLVLDNAMQPLGGATCLLSLDGVSTGPVVSDESGRFLFADVSGSGAAHLHVEGATVNRRGGSGGFAVPPDSYPKLIYDTEVVRNANNALATPVLLPPLDPANRVRFDNTQDITLRVAGVEGLEMTIFAGSMQVPDPQRPGQYIRPDVNSPVWASLNQVHHDDIPMPMPDGAAPPFSWTLQPAGALFDPPVKVKYPNMTGLPPGATVNFLSFDHDTGKFEIVASGRVCEDGSCSETDRGSGIAKAGWGCQCPPYAPVGRCRPDCDLATVVGETGLAIRLRGQVIAARALLEALRALATAERFALAHDTELMRDEFGVITGFIVGLAARSAFATIAYAIVHQNIVNAVRENVPTHRLAVNEIILATHRVQQRSLELRREIESFNPRCVSLGLRDELTRMLNAVDEQLAISLDATGRMHSDIDELERLASEATGLWDAIIAYMRRLGLGSSGLSPSGELEEFQNQIGTLSARLLTLQSAFTEQFDRSLDAIRVGGAALTLMDELGAPGACTVVVNGQSAVSAANGNYDISNVAATGNLVRAIATCRTSAGELYAASDYFVVPINGVVRLPDLPFSSSPVSTPTRIIADADPRVMTRPLQQSQVSVMGVMQDGRIVALNGAVRGTTYVLSNSAVVTVSDTGLLIAQGNGIAFVTCQNEGATSTAQITVSMDDLLTVAEGDVLLPGGGRAPQFDVVLGSFGRTRTNSEGHFRIESVPTRFGRLRVQVSGAIAGAYYAGQSRELDPRPGAVTDFGLIEARPQAVENVIVSADSGDRVVRFLRPDGAEISRVTVDIPVQGVANDPMGSVWLVGGTKVMQVQREPFLVRASTTIAGASFNSVALSPDGHAWVTDQGRNRLIRLDASGAVVAEFDAPPTRIDPRGVAVLPLVNKNYFVYYTSYSPKSSFTGELTRVDPLGGPTISTVFPGDPVLSVAVTPQGTICVPVDSRGAGQDRVEVWDMGLRTRLNSLSIPHDWKQMRAVVVTPDSHIWVATAENFGRFLPAYLYHFDPAANRLVESLPLSSPQEPGVYPSGCWCDGEGKVWVSVSTVDRLFIHDRRTQASSTLPVGDAPVNQGDPSGYLMAHIIFPDRDFDGDGVNNRAELQAGTNPFVFNR